MTNNVRRLALDTLVKIEQGAYSSLELNQIIQHHELDTRDVGLLTQIVYGVLQNQYRLDYQLAPFLKRSRKIDPWVRVLLQTALYQMTNLDRIPKRAIFNETIKIAKQKGHDGIRRMVTGILHQIDRSKLRTPEGPKDSIDHISIEDSIPKWIIEQLTEQLGSKKAASIANSINRPAKQSVRVNLKLISKEQLMHQLEQEGYHVEESQLASEGLILSGRPANQSQAFQDGLMTIQDESAMLPVESMPIKSDQVILDACSAPGGKTTQIAERLGENGRVVALDLHKKRLDQVTKNATRMKVADKIETLPMDARKISQHFNDQTFDQILVDAPCSGIGLMRRKPEIRYEKSLDDVQQLHKVQLSILDHLAPTLKVGGQLTYSTCTILNQENLDVVNNFLSQHDNFHLKPVRTGLRNQNESDPTLRIYPDDDLSDGFFVCNLVKDSE